MEIRDHVSLKVYARNFLIISLTFFSLSPANAQSSNMGVPFVSNYSKQDYGAATQNWGITQDSLGVMYFANNQGLLIYDGQNWSTQKLPNRTIVRSVLRGEKRRIYAGGQDELGYFTPDQWGHLRFQSLKDRLPKGFRSFEDVWNLCLQEEILWMRTSRQICRISPTESEGFRPRGEFGYMALVNGAVHAFDTERGILRWTNGNWELIPSTAALINHTVTGLMTSGDSLWIATARSGVYISTGQDLFKPEHPVQEFFTQNRIHAMIRLRNQQIAIGTSLAGVLILSPDLRPLSWIRKANGLQHNYILSLFEDRDQNLWAGLNNGIDYLEINSPFRRLMFQAGEGSAGYAAIQSGSYWWLGTGTGLFKVPYNQYRSPLLHNEEQIQPVSGLTGQVWGLDTSNGSVMIGHHEGCFSVVEGLKQISNIHGFWTFANVPGRPDLMAAGTYEGIFILRRDRNDWALWKKVPGLEESSRLLAADDYRLWMAHPYRGVFSIDFSSGINQLSIKKYGQQDGLPNDHFNHVFKVFGQVFFGTTKGIYEYDPISDSFREDSIFQKVMGRDTWVKDMKEDQEGNVWFITEEGCGRLLVSDLGLTKKLSIEWLPELNDKLVKGHEFVYPFDGQDVFFGVDEGFIRYNPSMPRQEVSAPCVVLSGIRLLGEKDSLIFGGWIHQMIHAQDIPAFHHHHNTWRFSVSATQFQQNNPSQYRFYLEGLEAGWLAWGTNAEKEYAQLPPGTYTFHAQSRDAHGRLSDPLSFSFEIHPPWYASQTANVIYAVLGLVILLGLLLLPQRKFKVEKEKLQSDLLQKEEVRKQEVQKLKTQSLTAEVSHKNRELATATMHLVQKNETLTKIRSELEKLQKEINDISSKNRIRSLLRMMNEDDRLDKDWEQFAYHFDQVHSGFLHRLREQFPHITPKDHRLCAYLRMNLSSKEIAPLMNISVRGVEISRYRLRKKLHLDRDTNLNDFMMNF